MLNTEENNYAFIDSQNVNLGVRELGWKLDFAKFRVYLKEKHAVKYAYIFIGYIPGNDVLYSALQKMGYICVFKPVLFYADGKVKGNCDGELILQAMIDYNHYDKAIVVTGDGDFACLIQYLYRNNKLKYALVPNINKYSALLRPAAKENILFMNNLEGKLAYKNEKAPPKDET